MKKKILFILLFLLCFQTTLLANDTILYTLATCREMALSKGASQRSAQEGLKAAEYNRKAALAAFFPKITANGAYLWNSRDAHLLANQTQFDFGTVGVNENGTSYFNWSSETPLSKLINLTEGTPFQQPMLDLQQDAGQKIADAYQQLYNTMTIDMTHVLVAQVGITQPIYTGGRITQMYKIAKATENIAALELNQNTMML